MLKKLLFPAFLLCFALSANAQIATPQLDGGFHTYGGAAAGWRYNNTITLVGLSAKGDLEQDGEKTGEVTAGMGAKGPEDSSSSIPFLLAAFRTDTFGGELYTNIADGLKTDIEFDAITGYADEFGLYKEEKELRINLAYILAETLSVGLGYYSTTTKDKQIRVGANVLLVPPSTFGSIDAEQVDEYTTTGTSLTASWRLGDIFFLAGGMENVTMTGTQSTSTTTSLSGSSSTSADYVENSWTNTLYGVGMVTGSPGDTQFKLEYSIISSPESEKDAEGTKLASSHAQSTTSFAVAEAKFGDFLVGYQSITDKEAEINDEENETVTSFAGVGWQPQEGLTLSLYSFDRKVTTKDSSGELTIAPKGYRFFIGYNF